MASYDLGPYRMNFKGEFNGSEEYRYMDVVRYNGGSYICKNLDTVDGVACIGILPEGEAISEEYWECLAHKGDKGEAPATYSSYLTITDGNWDYSKGDKIFIPDDITTNSINITGVYDGACGIIITRKELELPSNSMKSIDFNFVELITGGDYYFYTFTYSNLGGSDSYLFIWHRTVITKS